MEISIFDGEQQFHTDKKISLIELFAGYGSQALALKYLGIPFEHYFISEWAVKSIQAYKDMHYPDDNRDYSYIYNDKEVRKFLYGKISKDYNSPLTDEQIDKMPIAEARHIVNNMFATNNKGSVVGIHGKDVPLRETDKYTYVLFYSFPCQDLSNAGLQQGYARDSGTRSSMLWQVERLLNEWNEIEPGNLPAVLIMENVPEVQGKKNLSAFSEWIASLDKLGYRSYKKVLNATDYGVPQNRERCFMVSILGNYFYEFPEPIKLDYRLKHIRHRVGSVPEEYYLSEEQVANFVRSQPVNVERAVTPSDAAAEEAQMQNICGISWSKEAKIPIDVAKTLCAHNGNDGWNQNQCFNAIMEKK